MSLPRPPRRRPRHLTRRFFARFRRNTDADFCSGNRLLLLRSGADFFTELFAALEAARLSICLEFYIVRNDQTGQRLADSLQQAVARGVKVHFLYDYFGCFDTPDTFFRDLSDSGIACTAFNPPSWGKRMRWFDRRDHRKIVVIDGQTAFAGGVNIGDEYAGTLSDDETWRDVGLRIDGPSAGKLRQLFDENWHEASGQRPVYPVAPPLMASDHADAVAIVSGSPYHNRSRIRDAFLLGLAGAATRVCVETPYFVPDPRFLRALLRAVRRGVQVQLILPAHSDIPLVQIVNRSFYAALLKAGVEVYERQGAILHAKAMVIDSAWSVIGSANLDQRSFHRNYEVSVIVASAAFGRQVQTLLDHEMAGSYPITLSEHERRGGLIRVLEWLASFVGWFL